MINRAIHILFGATLFLLPLVGLGTVYILTGHDTGAGFQPAYLTMALIFILEIIRNARQYSSSEKMLHALLQTFPVAHLFVFGGAVVVVLLSAAGIKIAPVSEDISMVWGRFFRQIIQLFIMGCFTVFITGYLSMKRGGYLLRWQGFARFLVLGALLQVAYGLIQEIHFYHPLSFFPGLDEVFTSNPSILSGSETLYLNNTFQNVPRLRGMVCEPLYLGNYLLLVWPFVFLTGWSRFWRGLIICLLLGLLLLTWSRGAWLGFLFQITLLFVFFLLQNQYSKSFKQMVSRKQLVIILAIVTGLVVVLFFGIGGSNLAFPFERLRQTFSTQDWSNLTRIYSMQAAWRAFLLSPVFGVGWGQFVWHFPLLVDPMGLQSQFTWPVVNNFPLQILSETGVMGFSVFLLSTLYFLKRVLLVCRNQPVFSLPVLALVATCGVWIQLFSFSQFNLPHIWVALGTLAAVAAYPGSAKIVKDDNS